MAGVFAVHPVLCGPAECLLSVRDCDPCSGIVGDVRDAAMRPFVRYLSTGQCYPGSTPFAPSWGLPVSSVDDFLRRAPLLLAVGGEPFEYRHPGWGDLVHHIGACVFEPVPTRTPDWITAIDRPLVLVNTSSIRQPDTAFGVGRATRISRRAGSCRGDISGGNTSGFAAAT